MALQRGGGTSLPSSWPCSTSGQVSVLSSPGVIICPPVCLSTDLLYKPVDRVTRSTLVLHVSRIIEHDSCLPKVARVLSLSSSQLKKAFSPESPLGSLSGGGCWSFALLLTCVQPFHYHTELLRMQDLPGACWETGAPTGTDREGASYLTHVGRGGGNTVWQ